ncbi:hypothetical protein BRADI_2g12933v3 [Brachypodium distachyon]|uniref:Uncharacterized protein n=1 Tax=Brachypodium distachyon TaxID=15368 RepID=A0A2K2D894_BRADI|nr:hypothetical protein BRADI_2g12933v3 [Brachypodium distachyon]
MVIKGCLVVLRLVLGFRNAPAVKAYLSRCSLHGNGKAAIGIIRATVGCTARRRRSFLSILEYAWPEPLPAPLA